jgi:hypothetical protein
MHVPFYLNHSPLCGPSLLHSDLSTSWPGFDPAMTWRGLSATGSVRYPERIVNGIRFSGTEISRV